MPTHGAKQDHSDYPSSYCKLHVSNTTPSLSFSLYIYVCVCVCVPAVSHVYTLHVTYVIHKQACRTWWDALPEL